MQCRSDLCYSDRLNSRTRDVECELWASLLTEEGQRISQACEEDSSVCSSCPNGTVVLRLLPSKTKQNKTNLGLATSVSQYAKDRRNGGRQRRFNPCAGTPKGVQVLLGTGTV